ncbi:hypothetical protein AGRO_4618 [Agrobacterium sp. ATCC 31749]|nr:hypothetical protein AGRO_4618 [Agrobacterium sp. ATCC 31749]KJX88404.1 hypothetical protein SY94_1501 [Agrobacterium tumefaciens]
MTRRAVFHAITLTRSKSLKVVGNICLCRIAALSLPAR